MTNDEVRRAERDLRRSAQRLDRALTDLEERMDLTAERTRRKVEKVEEAIATIREPVDTVRGFVVESRGRLLGAVRRLRERSLFLTARVREDPKPVVIGAIALLAGVALVLSSRRNAARHAGLVVRGT